MRRAIKKLDLFGASVPGLNIKGEQKVNSVCGGLASFVVLSLTTMYAILKLKYLLENKNPEVHTSIVPLPDGERFNTGSNEFMLAVSVTTDAESTANIKAVPKGDPRYIQW